MITYKQHSYIFSIITIFSSLHSFGLSDTDLDIFMPLLGKKFKKKKKKEKLPNLNTAPQHVIQMHIEHDLQIFCRLPIVKSFVPYTTIFNKNKLIIWSIENILHVELKITYAHVKKLIFRMNEAYHSTSL